MADDKNGGATEQRDREKDKKVWQRYIIIGIAVLAFLMYVFDFINGKDYTQAHTNGYQPVIVNNANSDAPDENGSFTSKDEVARYINAYGKLPQNFITKDEAKALGWVASEGNLNKVAPGKSIGGDSFGNYEQLLPDAAGREWTECDIGYKSGARGAKRIVFSNDGLIYYTDDHYESFTLLYENGKAAA